MREISIRSPPKVSRSEAVSTFDFLLSGHVSISHALSMNGALLVKCTSLGVYITRELQIFGPLMTQQWFLHT